MLIDHRTYQVHPGKLNEFLKIYGEQGLPIQKRYLGEPFGWFVSHDIGPLNQVVHMWKYESLADREQRRAGLAADPDWQAYLAKASPLLASMENKILRPAPFFQLA
ncbi:NIPSNAP family protein [Burkholderiaceae bacterium FT117]|uniref:NIPSNAP family protein n=1 Tax=Zeimonas sediminis TaxID=2944268 RepID=UPI002342CDE2|nr:NIPSNAP family protein [Zeimonas sediminis]MCM5572188.1 NIPSNAP family protein [Zeimonas sediminis]